MQDWKAEGKRVCASLCRSNTRTQRVMHATSHIQWIIHSVAINSAALSILHSPSSSRRITPSSPSPRPPQLVLPSAMQTSPPTALSPPPSPSPPLTQPHCSARPHLILPSARSQAGEPIREQRTVRLPPRSLPRTFPSALASDALPSWRHLPWEERGDEGMRGGGMRRDGTQTCCTVDSIVWSRVVTR